MRPAGGTDILFLRGPEVMEQDSQLTGDGYDGLVLGLLAASGCETKAPLSKREVSTMWPQDVVGALDQQTSQIRVASLGDAELRVAFAGLAAFLVVAQGSSPHLDFDRIVSYRRASGQTSSKPLSASRRSDSTSCSSISAPSRSQACPGER